MLSKYRELILVALAVLLVGAASAALADAPSQIKICVQADQQYHGVTDVIVGNMVSPGASCNFYYHPPAAPCWTWTNQGNNLNPFALMFNYKQIGVVKTAFHKLVLDPSKMGSGNVELTAHLGSCAVGGNTSNCVLAVTEVDGGGPGVTIGACDTVPSCKETACQPD